MVSVWATKGFLKPYVYGSATDGTLAKIMPYVTAGVLIAALFGPALHRALSLEVKTRDDDGEITLDAEHKPVKHTSSEGSVASGLADFSAGAMLGLGLGVSGMVNLQKVQSFLEVTRIPSGTWDPTLMAVLLSAVGVNLASFQIMSRMRSPPLLAPAGSPPLSKHLLMGPVGSNKKIDWKLIVGAAMFGLGWGAGGVCPGPSILALAGGGVTAMYVVPGMVLGLELKNFLIGE